MPTPWTNPWSAANSWWAGQGWVEFERQMTEMLIELAKQAVLVWMSAMLFWAEAFRLSTATRRTGPF
jgi:hypothetical protein